MALWQLARRGISVLGVEQFGIGHARGSYTGDSRLFRSTVHEGTRYVPLLQRAGNCGANWRRRRGGTYTTNAVPCRSGPAGSGSPKNSPGCAEKYDLPYELLDADALRADTRQHRVADDDAAVLGLRAGSLYPEASVLTAVRRRPPPTARRWSPTPRYSTDEEGGRLKLITSRRADHPCDKVVGRHRFVDDAPCGPTCVATHIVLPFA